MLYNATLGPTSHRHPEWVSFIAAFDLPCRNGFRFTQVGVFKDLSDIQYIYLLNVIMQLQALRAFEGGPETFLSLSGVSHITGYESVHDCIEVQSATQYHHQLAVQSTLGSPFSFESMFCDFLTDQGIPCPETFATITSSFNSVIDLSQIDSPAFRSRMFVWAATGSPLLDAAAQPISVCLFTFEPNFY